MMICVLTDDLNSWFIPYGDKLVKLLQERNHEVKYVHKHKEIEKGDICFILSCTRIIKKENLEKNKNNIVVHASDLPKGKGFSPLQWQILEGKNNIPVTLFEAVEDLDAGPYYLKSEIKYNGTELYHELRRKLAEKIIELCILYVEQYSTIKAVKQSGELSIYQKRTDKDDEIDIDSTVRELFNHFRIADNERFPLYFYYLNEKYYLKIEKAET